jgi:hypothetical protein
MRIRMILAAAAFGLLTWGPAGAAPATQGAAAVPAIAHDANLIEVRHGWRHRHWRHHRWHHRHYGWRRHHHVRHYGWYRGRHYGWYKRHHRHHRWHRYTWY